MVGPEFVALRRSALRRGRRRIGQAAQERVRAGGKLAVGRESATLEGWRAVKALVFARAKGRCEVNPIHPAVDVHHVTKRSQGGSDLDLDQLVALCRRHHDQSDAAFAAGRLVITPLGGGKFHHEVIRKENKWASR